MSHATLEVTLLLLVRPLNSVGSSYRKLKHHPTVDQRCHHVYGLNGAINHRKNVRLVVSNSGFHCHSKSLSFGGFCVDGTSGFASSLSLTPSSEDSWACSSASLVSTEISRGCGAAPKFWTAGNPFLTHRNFNVKRGPISCRATFSGDRNAYLCLLKNKKSRWLCRVTTWRPWNSGRGGNRV